jgi:hypothetical protein
MNFSEMSDIFYNNIFFKWITPDASGSERGGGQTRPLPKQNFFSADRVQKKIRRRSESQKRFFFGNDSDGWPKKTGDFDI